MITLSPQHWKDYELLDSGDYEKLERFGDFVLRRPEPGALWRKSMHEKKWEKLAHARFVASGGQAGRWEKPASMQQSWYVNYNYKRMQLKFRLSLMTFKHVGLFPEQASNWNYIYDSVRKIPNARVLNLFAYTGAASLAAKAAGADVIHCDSSKSVVKHANQNMQSSQLSDIRWLIEDSFTFVKREARRGKRYNGIILDPPTFGHGPKGKKWKIEEMINELVMEVARILDMQQYFLVINAYRPGFSANVLHNLVHDHFGPKALKDAEFGELCLKERSGRLLPAGVYGRFGS